jgi:hypothetical protein
MSSISWVTTRVSPEYLLSIPEVVHFKALSGREVARTFNTGWEVGTVKGVEIVVSLQSFMSQTVSSREKYIYILLRGRQILVLVLKK